MTRKLYSKDSNGGDAAVQKKVAIPAILMGVLCLLSSGIETFMSLDFTRLFLFIREDSMDQLRALLMGFVKVFSHDSAEQLVGLVIFIVILFLRKKQLSAIKYRDIAVLVIYFVAAVGLARFSAILNKFLISDNLSHMANVAVGEKTNAIAMFSAPVLVNWLGLGVFVLARTGAKKFARVAGGAVVAVALVLSVFGGITAGKLLSLISLNFANVIAAATPLTRIALLLNFASVVSVIFFWLAYGEGLIRFGGALGYCFIQPILVTLLGAAVVFVSGSVVNAGMPMAAGLAFAGLGEPLAYVLGVLYLVGVIILRKKREAKKAAAK